MKEKGLWKKVKINVVAKSQIIVRVYLKSIKEQPSGYQMHALSSSVVSPLCGAPALNYARSPHLWSQEGEQKGGEAAFAIHPGHAKLKLSSECVFQLRIDYIAASRPPLLTLEYHVRVFNK